MATTMTKSTAIEENEKWKEGKKERKGKRKERKKERKKERSIERQKDRKKERKKEKERERTSFTQSKTKLTDRRFVVVELSTRTCVVRSSS